MEFIQIPTVIKMNSQFHLSRKECDIITDTIKEKNKKYKDIFDTEKIERLLTMSFENRDLNLYDNNFYLQQNKYSSPIQKIVNVDVIIENKNKLNEIFEGVPPETIRSLNKSLYQHLNVMQDDKLFMYKNIDKYMTVTDMLNGLCEDKEIKASERIEEQIEK